MFLIYRVHKHGNVYIIWSPPLKLMSIKLQEISICKKYLIIISLQSVLLWIKMFLSPKINVTVRYDSQIVYSMQIILPEY